MIIVCGEALVDLVQVGSEDGSPLLRSLPGGSPANAAVALARLGEPVALASRLGNDSSGELIRDHLKRNGVDTSWLVTAAEPTTLALVSLSSEGDARYAFYFDATASAEWRSGDLPSPPPGLQAVHIGSMALGSPTGRRVIGGFLGQLSGVTISLDPNVRMAAVDDLSSYRRDLETLVGAAHLVRVSSEDLELLYPDQPVGASGARWAALGSRLVVVSRGATGPLAFFGAEQVTGRSFEVEAVDTVGAGDTFSAALLHFFAGRGLLSRQLAGLGREHVEAALDYAAAASSITCERQGADPPTADEVSARLSERRDAATLSSSSQEAAE